MNKLLAAAFATTALATGAVAQTEAISEFRIGILGGENAQDRMNSNECMRAMTEDALGVPRFVVACCRGDDYLHHAVFPCLCE